jgi:ribokinase
MKHILVVGSINMDLVVRVPQMPVPGETVLGDAFQTFPGGKGANQAVGAARLGGQVTMVGKVGEDGFGSELRASMAADGINLEHVTVDPSVSTGIAMITVDETGQNSIVVASGANMALTPKDVTRAWGQLESVDVVVLQLEIPAACNLQAARLGKEMGAKVILNPAPARPLSAELLQLVDVIVPNEKETSLLTGLPVDTLAQVEAAAQVLLKLGVGSVVLTLGSRGALVLEASGAVSRLESHSVEVVDTTAAGDAFVAGLSVRLAQGASLAEAAVFGNASGALAVSRMGAQPSLPTREEALRLVDSN